MLAQYIQQLIGPGGQVACGGIGVVPPAAGQGIPQLGGSAPLTAGQLIGQDGIAAAGAGHIHLHINGGGI